MAVYEQEFKLWADKPPFYKPADAGTTEHFQADKDGINRLTDVTIPTLTWYPCAWSGGPEKRIHPAVLVCPGGGYSILAWNHEGRDICAMLNRLGFAAFLLKYRCPGRRDDAFADAARAMRFIRANAEEFGIDPTHVGCIGFSAGANLCARISAPASEPYPAEDEMDKLCFRPDFTALIYPWDIAYDDLSILPNFKVDEKTPPSLLIQAEDDFAKAETSVAWFLAMKKAGRPVEMHIWPSGGHGYGLILQDQPTDAWPEVAGKWFRRQI